MFKLLSAFWLGNVTEKIKLCKLKAQLPTNDESIQNANLGKIVVVGNESVGKSWILDRCLQLPIFDRGRDVITRCPFHTKLIFSPKHTTPKMIFKAPGKPVLETLHAVDILLAIREIHAEIEASGIGISEKVVYLEIYSSVVPNIILVDPPGLLSYPAPGEPLDLPQKVAEIMKKCITETDCVILHIRDGQSNQRTSPSASLLKEMQQTKTLKIVEVMTKVDLLKDDRESEPMLKFFNTFDVKNPDTIAVINYAPHENATFDEITA